MKRTLALASLVLAAGAVGSLLGVNSVHPTVIPPSVAFARPTYAERMLLGGAQGAQAAALAVEIQVTGVTVNDGSNSYTETIGLCVSPCTPSDTSGLSNFSMTFSGTGITPRYPINGATALSLP